MTELIGRDPSVDGATAMIVERSAGNRSSPRDQRRAWCSSRAPGDYVSTRDVAGVSLPATVRGHHRRPYRPAGSGGQTQLEARPRSSGEVQPRSAPTSVSNRLWRNWRAASSSIRSPRTPAWTPRLPNSVFPPPADPRRRLRVATERIASPSGGWPPIEQRDPPRREEHAALIAEHLRRQEFARSLRLAYGTMVDLPRYRAAKTMAASPQDRDQLPPATPNGWRCRSRRALCSAATPTASVRSPTPV